jgi:septum site-determining protein MinD
MDKRMTDLIVIHSYKGGTGKSLLSLNIAGNLAHLGNRVAILDYDFLGPSMFSVFGEQKVYLNEVIYGSQDVSDVMIEYNHPEIQEGKLYAGIADPEPKAINKILQMGQKEFKMSFENTMEAKDVLEDDFEIDYIIVDTGPGLRLDSANAIVVSDFVSLVLKPTMADLIGTKRLVHSMLKAYSQQKKIGIILNRALDTNWQIEASLPVAENDYFSLKEDLKQFSSEYHIPFLATIPCICDISRSLSERVLVLDYPNHSFSQYIKELSSKYIS